METRCCNKCHDTWIIAGNEECPCHKETRCTCARTRDDGKHYPDCHTKENREKHEGANSAAPLPPVIDKKPTPNSNTGLPETIPQGDGSPQKEGWEVGLNDLQATYFITDEEKYTAYHRFIRTLLQEEREKMLANPAKFTEMYGNSRAQAERERIRLICEGKRRESDALDALLKELEL